MQIVKACGSLSLSFSQVWGTWHHALVHHSYLQGPLDYHGFLP